MKLRMIIVLLVTILTSCALVPTETFTPTVIFTLNPPTPTGTPEVVPSMTPSPMPTQPAIIFITPDTIQVERWKEYQAELAKAITCDSGHDCPNYEYALCEWDILGRSNQEVYVWAQCIGPNASGRKPAIVYLDADGSIQKVRVAGYKGLFFDLELFPLDVQEKITLYYSSSCTYCGRPEELRVHLQYRQTHPEVPPLIILSAMPTATSIP